ncbi:hypothetical protein HHK36_029293 [Tetracentron sinense]|uniref:WAT1-related protein n=1 Tax=Tetracentron sinense TaxID=13715 RepID=A0A834YEP5_TETSI|nr:hypothetical protein HHK36_029293 [Tetracentron sinense]
MSLKQCVRASGPAVGMIAVQLIATGLQLLSRIILNNGTFIFALMAYRHVVAAVAVAPFAFFMEGDMRKRLNWLSLFWLFINALVGLFLDNRIETLGLRSRAGKIKIAGTILCVAGALINSFYKGKTFHIFHSHSHHTLSQQTTIVKTNGNWTRGTFMLIGMITNRSKDAWRLEWNLELLTIFYSGALATAATFILIMWTIAIRGPTYPSMFNPLSLIFVAISESLFFGEAIAVGSLMGMFVIIAFLWGKRNEPSTLPPLNANGGDTATVPESTKLQLAAATITPTVSLNTTVEEV